MAQDISLMGAQYSAVPAVVLPKTGGGTARFTDTSGVTATAEDVASGKVFVDASGEEQTGTASGGGGASVEALTVTENGVYTAPSGVGYSPVTVSVAGGGGEWWDTPDPTDGKTHIWIEIPEDAPRNRLTYYVRYTQSVSNGVTVDWGDGTGPQTFTGTSAANRSHTYAQGGHYEITLEVTSGTIKFAGSSSASIYGTTTGLGYSRSASIRRIFFGSGIAASNGIGAYAACDCPLLERVTLPNGITAIGAHAFRSCELLKDVKIPTSVTQIGDSAFSTCKNLQSVTIPDSVTTIASLFSWCTALETAYLPSGLTSIPSTFFSNCYALKSISIPDSVTTISISAFSSCRRLSRVTIPSGVTNIATMAFQNCYGMSEYHLKPTTPPSLASTNVFFSIPNDCKIYVPYSEDHSILEAYKAATNWSTYASRMVEEDAE